MTTTDPLAPQFVREDLARMLDAHRLLKDFEQFVLRRFADYTHHTEVTNERGRRVYPVGDLAARTNAGYGYWRVHQNWINILTSTINAAGPSIPVENYVENDRGPGSVAHLVHVPLSFVFGDDERDNEYAQYLALKEKFETQQGDVGA